MNYVLQSVNATSEVAPTQLYNSMNLSPVVFAVLLVAACVAGLTVVSYVAGAYRLGRGLRGILVSTKYFLMGGALITAGYAGYQGVNMLTLYAAAGDPIVMLRYTALAVGGYVGIACFGYVMSRFFKEYRGSFTRFKAGLIQRVETPTSTETPAASVTAVSGESKQ